MKEKKIIDALILERDEYHNRVDQLECELADVKAERDELKTERDRLKREVEDFQEALETRSIHELDEELKKAQRIGKQMMEERDYWREKAQFLKIGGAEKERDQLKEKVSELEGFIGSLLQNQNSLISAVGALSERKRSE